MTRQWYRTRTDHSDRRDPAIVDRAGFVVEGRRWAALKFDGPHIDMTMMAILRTDWAPAHRTTAGR